MAARFAAALVGLCLLGVAAGCAPGDAPTARFDDYLARLARTLNVDRPPVDTPAAVLYPAKRSLQLAGLTACRAGLDDGTTDDEDAAFRQRLDEPIAIKRRAVPRIFWNLTLGSDAVAHLFSVAGAPLGLQATAPGRASRQALARLAAAGRALADGEKLSADRLADGYQTLEYSTYGGQLQVAARNAMAALDAATAMLHKRLARRPVCFDRQPNRRARTLQTILLEIYGPNVQSYLADLVRAGTQWRAAVAALIGAQRVKIPPAFVDYEKQTLATDNGVWARLVHAIERHTDIWQKLLHQCSLMPGG